MTKGLLRPITRRIHALERRAGYLAHPAFAVFLYVGVLWLWHIPAMYDHAQGNTVVHALEHLSMGTSQDYVVAVQEGATIVRIGTRLYD